MIADGEHAVPLVAAQDHKRIFDDDRGPNTGGMGAFAPSPLVDDELAVARCLREIVRPVLTGLIMEGSPYRGVLVLRSDAHARRPEGDRVQRALRRPRSAGRAADDCGAADAAPVGRRHGSDAIGCACASAIRPHVGVVLAAKGYPGDVETGHRIEGLDRVAAECPDVLVFHAGVKEKDGALVTAGGRVMTIVGEGPDVRGRHRASL